MEALLGAGGEDKVSKIENASGNPGRDRAIAGATPTPRDRRAARRHIAVRTVRLLAVSAVAVFTLVYAGAVAHAADYITAERLESAQKDISSLSSSLDTRISAAQTALEDVKKMDEPSEREALVSKQFDAIEGEVRSVLEKVSLNSPFMDALDDARAKTLILKRWYERQPADYPDRDHSIARLDKAILEYERQSTSINQTSDDALRALTELGRTRGVILMELKIGKIETSIKRLSELTSALGTLSSKLATIASAQLPDAEAVPKVNQN